MKVRVGLMGFGRVGRSIFRILHQRDDVEVAAISDIADPKSLEYLLKYDTLLGRFPDAVSLTEGQLHTGGKNIKMLSGREPADTPWGELGVDVVIEASGRHRTRQDADKHLDMGAKRVVLCVPNDGADITIVMGVNHQEMNAKHRVISTGSVTAQCAVPLLKVLDSAFGIERLYFTTVHAYTNDQRLADVPAQDMRRSRAAAENIVPIDDANGQIFSQVLPSLKNKISGMSLRVPVPNGSVLDMVTFTRKAVTVQAVNDAVRAASSGDLRHIVEYCADPIVSSDVKQSAYSSTYDSQATMVLGEHAVKTLAWFDNAWGYAHRTVELVEYLARKEGGLS